MPYRYSVHPCPLAFARINLGSLGHGYNQSDRRLHFLQARHVEFQLLKGRGRPAPLGLDNHVQIRAPNFDVRDAASLPVLLQGHDQIFCRKMVGRLEDLLEKLLEKAGAVGQRPADAARDVVFFLAEKAEHAGYLTPMEEQIRHVRV
jgi:hypothetical protein